MVACNVSGDGTVSARGGWSRDGSGGGGVGGGGVGGGGGGGQGCDSSRACGFAAGSLSLSLPFYVCAHVLCVGVTAGDFLMVGGSNGLF